LSREPAGHVLRLSSLGGSRIRGVEGESSRGAKSQESIGQLVRGNPKQLRTDSQEGVKLRSR
jgi:hypothetical protein